MAAYLASNGVTYHDVDDAWAWSHTHLQELHGQYLGNDNPKVTTIRDKVEADARHSSREAVSHSREHILKIAETQGVEPQSIPPLMSSGECEASSDWQNQLTDTVELYPLPSVPPSTPSPPSMDVDHPIDSSSALLLKDGEVADLYEGPAPM